MPALGVANGRLFADDVWVYVAPDLRVGMIGPAGLQNGLRSCP